ncbi:hypothetical protein [Polaribacter sp. Hel1_85]|uniref:hypothetical protein n=1 Tax=Polaribacter sp. Hel1_85 TaxID=1250005 RepID=UPI00052BCDB9|nr:hypothetical protein [Polaribacter sp. Hel1_85]KGL61822.1 hypothetical protein PHEL85_1607 [Polaribacter sp. Hel1_85]
MNEEHINNIIKKYKAGKSSLQEEAFLFENVGESETEIKSIAAFVKQQKKIAPKNLNKDLWTSFEKRTNKNKKLKTFFISAAASIVLISALLINNFNKNQLSNNEKEALLKEAKSMFLEFDKSKPAYSVLVENDLLIVYTKIE